MSKLSDGIIEAGMMEQNMMEPNMMEPVDGSDGIHYDRANGDDLGENQELLNDRCVKSTNCYQHCIVIWIKYFILTL